MSDADRLLEVLCDRINELERGKESLNKSTMKNDHYTRGWIVATDNELKFLDKVITLFTPQVL